MFSKALTSQPLTIHDFTLYPDITNREAWANLDDTWKEETLALGETYLNFDFPALSATDFLDFTKTPKFLLLVWGLISLLLLSRLLGYKEIWKTLFLAMPIENISDFEVLYRPFKNIVEESVEIISYLALFLSALDPFSVKE